VCAITLKRNGEEGRHEKMPRVLVVEDEPTSWASPSTAAGCSHSGFDGPDRAPGGGCGVARRDLADWMLPEVNTIGAVMAPALGTHQDRPHFDVDRLSGGDQGCKEPWTSRLHRASHFSTRNCLALRAVLRRRAPQTVNDSVIQVGDLSLDAELAIGDISRC
jgi:hypothetical protein